LREFEIGVILDAEQIDVRRLLLADSPAASTVERCNSFHFVFSNFAFPKDLPWPH
jgi:hypothetical protein